MFIKSITTENVVEVTSGLSLSQIRVDKSYMNNSKIVELNLPYKFSYLDEWLLKESNLLYEEAELLKSNLIANGDEKKIKKYRCYKRGTIVRVDFGVNLGSEMSQVHFAIVLNNYDSNKNNAITVLPLTSKKSNFNLNLDELVIKTLIKKVELEMTKYSIEVEQGTISKTDVKLFKLNNLIRFYKSCIKHSYGCVNLVTTISKTRILKPINEYDIIGRSICSSDVLDMIDKAIKKNFTSND